MEEDSTNDISKSRREIPRTPPKMIKLNRITNVVAGDKLSKKQLRDVPSSRLPLTPLAKSDQRRRSPTDSLDSIGLDSNANRVNSNITASSPFPERRVTLAKLQPVAFNNLEQLCSSSDPFPPRRQNRWQQREDYYNPSHSTVRASTIPHENGFFRVESRLLSVTGSDNVGLLSALGMEIRGTGGRSLHQHPTSIPAEDALLTRSFLAQYVAQQAQHRGSGSLAIHPQELILQTKLVQATEGMLDRKMTEIAERVDEGVRLIQQQVQALERSMDLKIQVLNREIDCKIEDQLKSINDSILAIKQPVAQPAFITEHAVVGEGDRRERMREQAIQAARLQMASTRKQQPQQQESSLSLEVVISNSADEHEMKLLKSGNQQAYDVSAHNAKISAQSTTETQQAEDLASLALEQANLKSMLLLKQIDQQSFDRYFTGDVFEPDIDSSEVDVIEDESVTTAVASTEIVEVTSPQIVSDMKVECDQLRAQNMSLQTSIELLQASLLREMEASELQETGSSPSEQQLDEPQNESEWDDGLVFNEQGLATEDDEDAIPYASLFEKVDAPADDDPLISIIRNALNSTVDGKAQHRPVAPPSHVASASSSALALSSSRGFDQFYRTKVSDAHSLDELLAVNTARRAEDCFLDPGALVRQLQRGPTAAMQRYDAPALARQEAEYSVYDDDNFE